MLPFITQSVLITDSRRRQSVAYGPLVVCKGTPGGPGAPSYNEYVKRLPLFVFQSGITQKSVYLHDDMKCNNNRKKNKQGGQMS